MQDYIWLNKYGRDFLKKDYLLPGQTVDERVDIMCKRAEEILKIEGFAEQFKENVKKGWYSFSSPVWSNFGADRGLSASCFGSYISDSMESILESLTEVGIMTKHHGGTSAFFGELRHRGSAIKNSGHTSGSVHFMRLYDNLINVVSQGNLRRGSFAAYLPLDHEDILEFLNTRSEGNPLQDISFGVTVPEGWLQSMIDGDKKKRKIWARVLEVRTNTGYPYIIFSDNMNNGAPQVYKDHGMKIHQSNLCTEIALPNSELESFVCFLSSMNLLYYHDWKNTNAVELLMFFLDATVTEFIEKAKKIKHMERAVRFSENQRALGIGWLGWHSFLQSQMIPFESQIAEDLNVEIAQYMDAQTMAASKKLFELYGTSDLLRPYGVRNATRLSIAPTKSSSFIMEQSSEGIEPEESNCYIKDLAKGKFTFKNKFLTKILEERGQNTDEVWLSILKNRGSVKHLDFLTNHEHNVFKTFAEIDQHKVIKQAADRQKYMDQSQSLNLIIHPSTPVKEVNALIIDAWRQGVKSLYYQKSINAAQEFSRSLEECASCSI